MSQLSARFPVMKAIVEVGCVLRLHGESDRVGAKQMGICQLGCVREVGGCVWDVVACREEERGGGLGDGDWGKAGWKGTGIVSWSTTGSGRASGCGVAFCCRDGSNMD